MIKPLMLLCSGLFLASSFSAYAASADEAAEKADAEPRCLAAAQERYGVSADDVQSDGNVKWHSGVKGYSITVAIKSSTGKTKKYLCVARRNGKVSFYAE